MALTTKFVADFSSFYDAVQKATVQLDGFEKEAKNVEGALNKMVDSLSGRKVIENAAAMARAVEDIGGASKLTEAELRKVGRTVGEAAEKMEKMGIEVPKSFREIQTAAAGVQKPTKDWGDELGKITGLIKGFMALEVVQWFKQAATAALQYADTLSNLNTRTGISIAGLQRLEAIGVTSGVSLDTLAGAVGNLQNNLDNPAAVKAIEDMGLNFSRIRGLDPETMFLELAQAVAAIEDPVKRADTGSKIFGKTWQTISPAITGDMQAVIDKVRILGDETVKELDKADDQIDIWALNFNKAKTSYIGDIALIMNELGPLRGLLALPSAVFLPQSKTAKEFAQQLQAARIEAEKLARLPKPPELLIPSTAAPTVPGGEEYYDMIRQGTADRKAEEKAANAQADALKELNAVMIPLTKAQRDQVDIWAKSGAPAATMAAGLRVNTRAVSDYLEVQKLLAKDLPTATLETFKFAGASRVAAEDSLALSMAIEANVSTLEAFRGRFKGADMYPEPPAGTLEAWKKTQTAVASTMPLMMRLGANMRDFIGKDFGQIVVSAITGGGDAVKGALTGFGNALFAKDGAFGVALSGGIGKLFGPGGVMGQIGSALGSMVPMIGSFIGPAIEGITALGKKLFGKGEEGEKVSPMRAEFFKLQGGLDALNPRVLALGGSLEMVQAVFNAKTVEDYNAAIANLNALFKVEEDAVLALTAAAEKYGFTLEELGPAFQRQQLDKQAQELYKDWEVLNAAGIDTTLIAGRMSEAINAYAQDAKAMGVEVPAAMKPMLEQMIDMGKLTDASGNKIGSLEDAGLTFSLTMSEGFKSLIKEVQNLADVLRTGLGRAVEETSDKIGRIPRKVTVETEYKETGTRPSGGGGVPGYQGGTGGKFVDFGAGSLVMLHGREAVVPEGDVRPAGGGAVGGAGVSITINAQGAFFDTPGDLQRLADRVNEALTAKYGLTNRVKAA
jgi:hypothetical protein